MTVRPGSTYTNPGSLNNTSHSFKNKLAASESISFHSSVAGASLMVTEEALSSVCFALLKSSVSLPLPYISNGHFSFPQFLTSKWG